MLDKLKSSLIQEIDDFIVQNVTDRGNITYEKKAAGSGSSFDKETNTSLETKQPSSPSSPSKILRGITQTFFAATLKRSEEEIQENLTQERKEEIKIINIQFAKGIKTTINCLERNHKFKDETEMLEKLETIFKKTEANVRFVFEKDRRKPLKEDPIEAKELLNLLKICLDIVNGRLLPKKIQSPLSPQ